MAGTETTPAPVYLLFDASMNAAGTLADARLEGFSERHRFDFETPPALQVIDDLVREVSRLGHIAGVIIKLDTGLPRRSVLRLVGKLLPRGKSVYFYWPLEGAIEVIDRLRLHSLWRHWLLLQVHRKLSGRGAAAEAMEPDNRRRAALARVQSCAASLRQGTTDWIGNLSGLAREAARLACLREDIARGRASGDLKQLGTALGRYRGGLETAIDLLGKCQLSSNRISYGLADLAKDAAQPALAGAIEPTRLLEIRTMVLAANEQIGNIRRETELNLPGIRETGSMLAHLGAGRGDAAAGAAVQGHVEVVLRLAATFEGYFDTAAKTGAEMVAALKQAQEHVSARLAVVPTRVASATIGAAPTSLPKAAIASMRSQLASFRSRIAPLPLELPAQLPTAQQPLPGTGIYLRTDYWAPILSGGSYGHTCYQARALARTTETFIAVLANRFPLLDDLGVRQVVIRPDALDGSEASVVRANEHYYLALKPAFEMVRPAYVFERLCLGNFACARICRELEIPYLVEYNGSEISMKRSFDKTPYQFEDYYLEAEQASFEQASLISVVSEAVRDDLVKRGIAAAKVLVNWNAVALDAYKPLPEAERGKLRAELGFAASDRVICFIGTFGGWHGIEVLSQSMPRVLAEAPDARFLLIGDGRLKPLIEEAVATHKLAGKVVQTGRVEQARGAHLMAAADIFVSPHATDMVDGRFFGSPTKLFEYMAYGRGIVATDLEQIGEVMRPALGPHELDRPVSPIAAERGVLCQPGDVAAFVAAVVGLVRHPELAAALGRNARLAAERDFTWDAHVAKLWRAVADRSSPRAAGAAPRLRAGANGQTLHPRGRAGSQGAYHAQDQ